jgi:hypothetical protein
MIKTKRKNQIIYRTRMRQRLAEIPCFFFYLFSTVILTAGATGVIITAPTGIEAIMAGIILLAAILYFSFIAANLGNRLIINYMALSHEGIEWHLTGTSGFTTWDNVDSFGYAALSTQDEWNWGIRLTKPVQAKINAESIRLHIPRGAEFNPQILETFIPLQEIVNIEDWRMSSHHPFRRDVAKFIERVQYRPSKNSLSERKQI